MSLDVQSLDEPRIPVEASQFTCWKIRESFRPGGREFARSMGMPTDVHENVHDLRMQVNSALLRFQDEPEMELATLYLTEEQAWAVDMILPYDDGEFVETLRSVFRGLWGQEYGIAEWVEAVMPEVEEEPALPTDENSAQSDYLDWLESQ